MGDRKREGNYQIACQIDAPFLAGSRCEAPKVRGFGSFFPRLGRNSERLSTRSLDFSSYVSTTHAVSGRSSADAQPVAACQCDVQLASDASTNCPFFCFFCYCHYYNYYDDGHYYYSIALLLLFVLFYFSFLCPHVYHELKTLHIHRLGSSHGPDNREPLVFFLFVTIKKNARATVVWYSHRTGLGAHIEIEIFILCMPKPEVSERLDLESPQLLQSPLSR